jgi:FMN reductase
MKIATILGSVRSGNYTAKALSLVQNKLKEIDDVELIEIDPNNLNLGMPGEEIENSDSKKLQSLIEESSGVIISTPEYHGSISSVIKLVIENLGFPSVLSKKPVALLGVAAGQIGAIKSLEQLRSICSHVGALVLPGPVSVANVRSVFDEDDNCLDPKIENKLDNFTNELVSYVRSNACPTHPLEELVRENN